MRHARLTIIVTLFSASYASAWDRVGHLVVGAVAWEHMSEAARARAVDVLRQAPTDSDLAAVGFSPRELFLRAGYWPDIVRDETWPARKEKYDRSTWHYVNHFWRDGTPLPDMGTNGELVERLETLTRNEIGPIELAWILHLMGDIHQPLHSSARVSDRDPTGDRGGNDFELDDPEVWTLHGLWDTILRRSHRKSHSEGYVGWVSRVAATIVEEHPESSLGDELAVDDVEAWSRAGAELATAHGYPDHLVRDAAPPARYEAEVLAIAERQVALAGFRIAALLNERFD